MNWYVIYTKPRHEDIVSKRLRTAGIDVISPKIRSTRSIKNKIVESMEPFFPCYVFGRFDKNKHFHMVSYTRGVRYIVHKNNPTEVEDCVIDPIVENMKDGDEVVIRPPELQKGDNILIRSGPFKDYRGVFEREMRSSQRVMILLDAISCRMTLESRSLMKIT